MYFVQHIAQGVWEGGHITVRSTPRNATADAAAAGTSKASWAIAPCAYGFSTWSRKRFRQRQGRRRALPRICGPVAPRAGRSHGFVHSFSGAGTLLLHRKECGISGAAAAAQPPGNHGADEPTAEFFVGDFAAGRRNRADWSGGKHTAGACRDQWSVRGVSGQARAAGGR